jgi:hypothetical protein
MQPTMIPMSQPPTFEPTHYLSASIVKAPDQPVQMPFREQKVNMRPITAILGLITLLLAVILGLSAFNTHVLRDVQGQSPTSTSTPISAFPVAGPPSGSNVCSGKKPKSGFDNFKCVEAKVDEQAAADVSSPFKGTLKTAAEPILTSYWQAGLCPVNVHWHLGAEHRSAGQYDEAGTGPAEPKTWTGKPRQGLRCKQYSATDQKFTKPYDWKHCKHMQVGETYEVHWPHSAAGACGTINQYQTPFYDGVFCTDGVLTSTNKQIGVQAQVFTVVNDESYYYPDLIRGMIIDGEKGDDMVFYTGSTTGDSRSNDICSKYSPITWQVDRKCHLISASTFDKMCADMKAQRDDMTDDLHPHGSREVVADQYTANNMKAGSLSGGRATIP